MTSAQQVISEEMKSPTQETGFSAPCRRDERFALRVKNLRGRQTRRSSFAVIDGRAG